MDPVAEVWVISPTVVLPELYGDKTIIDGYSQEGAAEATAGTTATLRIVLDGSLASGASAALRISGGSNVIWGLVIRNWPGDGILIVGSQARENTVAGNFIGTDATATLDLGNAGAGIHLKGGATDNTVGPGNVIAHNGSYGVWVRDAATIGNDITQNAIYDNLSQGINLLDGAHHNIAAPAIDEARPGSVVVLGTACPGCAVELFANSDTDGEGETYLATSAADAGGHFTVTVGPLGDDQYLTATATDVVSGTSEFSAVYQADITGVFLPLVLQDA